MRTISGILGCLLLLAAAAAQAPEDSPERRAVHYLTQEVPRWFEENHCHSCHNNGDGARALYTAKQLGLRVPSRALEDTSGWLRQPLAWDHNQGEAACSDLKLARIQFASALASASASGDITSRAPLLRAAESLLPYQNEQGYWEIDEQGTVGSPCTYGLHLATYSARRVLEAAGRERFSEAIARADLWFLDTTPASVLDAAATVLALHDRTRRPALQGAEHRLRQAIEVIQQGQAGDGGWGPYAKSPSEVFDTAMAVLALHSIGKPAQYQSLINQGRAFLVQSQLPAGGWIETTRPSGSQSYAQHLCTTGWATLALLKTR